MSALIIEVTDFKYEVRCDLRGCLESQKNLLQSLLDAKRSEFIFRDMLISPISYCHSSLGPLPFYFRTKLLDKQK